MVHAS
jgi:hypothetical protein